MLYAHQALCAINDKQITSIASSQNNLTVSELEVGGSISPCTDPLWRVFDGRCSPPCVNSKINSIGQGLSCSIIKLYVSGAQTRAVSFPFGSWHSNILVTSFTDPRTSCCIQFRCRAVGYAFRVCWVASVVRFLGPCRSCIGSRERLNSQQRQSVISCLVFLVPESNFPTLSRPLESKLRTPKKIYLKSLQLAL